MLSKSGEGSGLKVLKLTLMQFIVFVLLDSHRRDVLILLIVAVRDGSLLLVDHGQILLQFCGGRVRRALQEIAAVLSDRRFVSFHLPRCEKRELVVLSWIVSAAHSRV